MIGNTSDDQRNKVLDADVKFKKEESLFSRILIGYFISFIILTYILPYNILDIIPILSYLVKIVSIIAPTVKRWGVFSACPQVTQLMYSLGIISIPFVSYMIFKKCLYPQIPSSFKKDENVSNNIFTFMCFLGSFLGIVMVFFVYPFPMKTHRILLDSAHYSRIGFAIGSSIWLEGTSLLISMLITMINYKRRMKLF